MKTLPPFVQEKLQPRLKVIWAGRRAVAEVVSEVSTGIFWLYIIFGIGWNVQSTMTFNNSTQLIMFWVVIGIVLILIAKNTIFELLAWYNEIYIVARDEVNGGGRLYKFFGWLNRRYVDEAITPQSPTILPEQPWYWRLWGFLTGEQMMKIKLASSNHIFIEGKKISPKFENAIKFIRGYKPPKEDVSPTSLANLMYLHEAKTTGIVSKKNWYKLEDAALSLIARNVHGE